MSKKNKLIVILGATATGKTKMAVKLAAKYNGEIISADSRQVYKGMDIGTGKDLKEYCLETFPRALQGNSRMASRGSKCTAKVPYHLIDVIDPKTPFNAGKYQKLAYRAIKQAYSAQKMPFLVGGTGLYIDAVTKGFTFAPTDAQKQKIIREKLEKLSLPKLLQKLKITDPKTYKTIDKKNRRRVQRALEIYLETGKTKTELDKKSKPDFEILILGINFPLEMIYQKIDSRLEARIEEGMVKEIKKLRNRGVSWKRLDEFGLEYRYVSRYLRGQLSYEEMLEELKNAIHHFAKRQLTWFKRNKEIIWINTFSQADKEIKKFLKS